MYVSTIFDLTCILRWAQLAFFSEIEYNSATFCYIKLSLSLSRIAVRYCSQPKIIVASFISSMFLSNIFLSKLMQNQLFAVKLKDCLKNWVSICFDFKSNNVAALQTLHAFNAIIFSVHNSPFGKNVLVTLNSNSTINLTSM